AGVWDMFDCPYRAFSMQPEEIGLLMDDLTPCLAPDLDQALEAEQEDALLRALALLHARFWESDVLDLPWLATTEHRLAILGPESAEEELRRPDAHPLFSLVQHGWQIALALVP